ncbi:MAG TPA: ABC transporter permease [Gemmatirosa sp.]
MLTDIRRALRALRRAPGFTLAAALCLALGIGATTIVLAVVDAVLLRPLPVRGLDRMVVLREDLPKIKLLDADIDPPSSDAALARRDLFDAGAAYTGSSANLTTAGAEPRRVKTASTLGDFFGLMNATAATGRFYAPDASRTASAQDVAVLSYGFWRDHFGGDPAIVGRTIRLDGQPLAVVGVAGPSLGYPRGADVYRPFPMNAKTQQDWGVLEMTAIARVRADVTPARLAGGLAQEAARWNVHMGGLTAGSADNGLRLHAVPFTTYLAGELRPITRLLLGAVALVLLVACANVACLQLVRATGRARELAVRAAIGARRAHLARPLAAESVVLAAGGGMLGVSLAWGTLALLRRFGPAQYPQLADAHADPRVLAGAVGATAFAALVFGLAPAVRAVRVSPQDALRGGSRGASAGVDRQRFLQGAVVTQVALAFTLALGAGLLVRSFARLAASDPGFRAEAAYTAHFGLPDDTAYARMASHRVAFDAVLQRLAGAPGVSAVALGSYLPMADHFSSTPFSVVGRAPDPGGQQPHAEFNLVSEDYFRALGIPLRRGRTFTRADDSAAVPVVIVDEQLAREFFPGEDPIGRQITQLGRGQLQIVGVVGSTVRLQLGEQRKALVYYPLRQKPWPSILAVVVRGALPPAAAEGLIRAAVAAVDPQLPVFDARPMPARVDESVGGRRLATWALGAFAAVGLLLAALGVYGVLSYAVAQRARELGVRSALGARRGDLERMIVGSGARLAGAGAIAGVLLFLAGRRALAALLYGIGPADPIALGAGACVLAAAVLFASWLPARRAARVDPAVALRAE